MTQGYQDWQRTSQQTGGLAVNDAAAHATPPHLYGPLNVAVWAALSFLLTPAGAASTFTLTIRWFADAAATQAMGSVSWTSTLGAVIVDEVVNLGPFVTITVACNNGAPDDLYTLRCVPISTVSPRAKSVTGGIDAMTGNVALAAGNTVTVFPTFITTGQAYFHANSITGNAFTSKLTMIDGAAVNLTIAVLAVAGAVLGQGAETIVYLPPGTFQLTVHNDSAGAGQFQAIVIPL